jgi:hypothetical protein
MFAPPPDAERLPWQIHKSLQSAFDRAIERQAANDASFIGPGRKVRSTMEVLSFPDGTFCVVYPIAAYDRDTGFENVRTVAEGVRNSLDGPVCIDHLGGTASWTALMYDDRTEQAYIVSEGIAGQQFDADDREPGYWSETLFQSAVDTFAATLLSGNRDVRGSNMVINRDRELVCVDHDCGYVLDYTKYTDGKRGIPDEIWPDVQSRMVEMAYDVLDTGVPDAISDARADILRVNARRVIESPHYQTHT